MDFDLLQKRRTARIIPKKTPLSQEVRRSILMLAFALTSIIVILSIVFLLNTSQSSQKGYILKQEQLKKEQLTLQNHDLVNKIIDAMAYSRIENSPFIKEMQKPETVQYLSNTP
jgi:hypothetical protein